MAEYMYRKGVEIDPHSYRTHINLIVFLSEHGKYYTSMKFIDSSNNVSNSI